MKSPWSWTKSLFGSRIFIYSHNLNSRKLEITIGRIEFGFVILPSLMAEKFRISREETRREKLERKLTNA